MSKGPQLTIREGLALVIAVIVAFAALAVTSAGAAQGPPDDRTCDSAGYPEANKVEEPDNPDDDFVMTGPWGTVEVNNAYDQDGYESEVIFDIEAGWTVQVCIKAGNLDLVEVTATSLTEAMFLTRDVSHMSWRNPTEPSPSPSETPSPTPTSTPSPTPTETPSPTPTPSPTITPTPTPTETETPSPSPTPTSTPTPTASPTPTSTTTPGPPTPTPTSTTTPTPSPSPTGSPSTEPPSSGSPSPSETTPGMNSPTPPDGSSTPQDELPRTGNNTGTLLVGMLGLLVLGGVSWGTRRWMLR